MSSKKTSDFLNDRYDTIPPNTAGGINQEWKEFLINISEALKNEHSQEVDGMEALSYNVNKKRKYYPPYTFDPEIVTLEDIKTHAITKQNKAESTFNKLINLVTLMETHPIMPVNMKMPHWTNFFQYMDHIKTNELKEHPHALKNRRDAWAMLCKVWGTYEEWPKYQLPSIPDRSRNIILPMPEKVNEILQYKYTNDIYLNKLIQYHFFAGFMIGMRPEKEIVILNTGDIILDNGNFPTIRITEPKKHNNQRVLKLEETIAFSKTNKSFKNYVDKIRPRFANKDETALFVNPNTGKRWAEANLRKTLLSKYGRVVWPDFWPYVMRHWSATARCIEWKNDNTVLYRVKDWHGHKKVDQTLHYISLAKLYDDKAGSWLNRALKRRRENVGGKRGQKRITQKNPSFVKFVRREKDGRGGVKTGLWEKKLTNDCKKTLIRFNLGNAFLLKFFSFFFTFFDSIFNITFWRCRVAYSLVLL